MAGKKYFAGPTADNDYNTATGGYFRLPLGHSAEDPEPDEDEPTIFGVVIPTNSGGDLTVVHEGTGGRLHLLDDDEDTILAGPSGTIYFTVPPGKHGELFVVAAKGDKRKVSCTFVQTGIAREAASDAAKPLIPWNFYFWPCARQFTDRNNELNPELRTQDQMLAKYAGAFGKSVDAALRWEVMNHQRDFGPSWLGHCHFASAASVLFETPTARTITSKSTQAPVNFTDEELKFLASEWYGSFGGKEVAFDLAPNSSFKPWPDLVDRAYTELLKPADVDLSNTALEAALTRVLLAYAPGLAAEDKAKTMAQKAAAKPAFRNLARQEFGRAAARFYGTLIQRLLRAKHPLISDFRGSGRDNSPVEVWNHVVFYYRASYKEILPSDPSDPSNNHYMAIDIKMVANADVNEPPSSSAPAVLAAGNTIEVDASAFQNRKSHQILWLAFTPTSGDIAGGDPRNLWKHCQGEREELYAPQFLAVLVPAGTTAATAQPNQDETIDLGQRQHHGRPRFSSPSRTPCSKCASATSDDALRGHSAPRAHRLPRL